MAKEMYRPSELKKLKNVQVYGLKDDVDEYPGAFDTTGMKKAKVIKRVREFAEKVGGTVYTGIHKENDWSRTVWWTEGWHYVNRTGEYAVVWEAKR